MYHVYGWSPAFGWKAWRFLLPPYTWGSIQDVCSALDDAVFRPPAALADSYVFVHHWNGSDVAVVGPGVLGLAEARELFGC